MILGTGSGYWCINTGRKPDSNLLLKEEIGLGFLNWEKGASCNATCLVTNVGPDAGTLVFATVYKFCISHERTIVRSLSPAWFSELPQICQCQNHSFCLNSGHNYLLQLFCLCCGIQLKIYLLSVNGMEIMTPFPVPTHKRLQDTIRAVILTNEKPSFPVPVEQGGNFLLRN